MLDACQATSALLYCVQEMHESMDITAEKEQFLTPWPISFAVLAHSGVHRTVHRPA
jgi:hypothetical protein